MDRVLIVILVLLLLLGVPGLLLVRQAEMHRACTAALENLRYVTDGNELHPKAAPRSVDWSIAGDGVLTNRRSFARHHHVGRCCVSALHRVWAHAVVLTAYPPASHNLLKAAPQCGSFRSV
jgi:hypothetical protein